jgi:uncharacterized damage-inducible protein DinB
MSELALSGEDVIAWNEKTTEGWRKLISAHPEALTLTCDIAGTKSAGELLQHIVAVELRYAERLAGKPVSDYTAIAYDSVEAIYATHDRAAALFREQLAADVDWNEKLEFNTRSMGPARSTRKTIFFHAQLHSIRHYAQLATLVRQHGIKPDWPMDYFVMGLELTQPQPETT